MVLFAISAPLVLSCMLRIWVDHSSISLLTDNLLLIIFAQWIPSLWTSLVISLFMYIGLAFYETRAEYMDFKGNVRENVTNNSEDPISSPLTSCPITPSLKFGMCPVKSFGLPGSTGRNPHTLENITAKEEKVPDGFCKETNDPQDLYGKPLLFPCELRHKRINPFKDRFQHSYLYVGVPIGLHATYSPILAIDHPEASKSNWPFREAWFNIRAQDHAIRGGSHMTLSQKLTEYLLSVGADPTEWAYAYLLAVPSINGQVDNPLGFWYLYTANKELTAIIPELNTSYGERRMWLVRQLRTPKPDSTSKKPSLYTFRGHFEKDIHVSPFMPSSGAYTIDTSDPCASSSNKLEILVTLTKPEGGPLILTRVSSTGSGLDVSAASMWEKLSFLARWCYVPTTTVMTYRILSQAARIYTKAPRVWKRPEPKKTALGKPARAVERTLERTFRLILKEAAENHPLPISVTYITPGEHSHLSETFCSLSTLKQNDIALLSSDGTITPPGSSSGEIDSPPTVEVHAISPIFYSRFFHYQSPKEAVASELLDDVRTRTLRSSNPNLLASIFDSTTPVADINSSEGSTYPPGSPSWNWRLLSLLRTAPIATNFPQSTPYHSFKGLSYMDAWVLKNCSPEEVKDYRRALLRVFLGEWIGGTVWPLKLFSDDMEPFGLSRDAVLRIYDAMVRAAMVTATAEAVRFFQMECDVSSVGLAGWVAAGINLWACLKSSL